MIRLGDSAFWVDATAEGWVLLEVVADKRQRATRRHGTFTSLRHVLQQRKVELPKGARRELADLVGAMEDGDDMARELPASEPPESPSRGLHNGVQTHDDPPDRE